MTAAVEKELREVAGTWWMFLVAGVCWLIYAWIVLSFEFETVWAIAVFAGFGFIAMGVWEFMAMTVVDSWKWLHALFGVIGIAAGVIAFAWPGQTFLTLAAIIAWWLLFKGTFDLVGALAARDVVDLWWVLMIIGIAEILVAFWAISYPGRSIVLLVVWVGAAALGKGITDIMLAFRLRELRTA